MQLSEQNLAAPASLSQGAIWTTATGKGGSSPVRRRRRSVDLAALSTLVLGVPWLVLSLLVVALLANAISGTGIGWICLAWLLTGVMVAMPVTERAVARLMLGFRRPTDRERDRLGSAWAGVLDSAGLSGSRLQLWVQESDDLNAYASGGHIVAVTRGALTSFPARQLEALLAHELGHHLAGHAWVSLITYWYSIPARLAWRCLRLLTRLVLTVVSIFSALGHLFVTLFVGLAVITYLGAALSSPNRFMEFVMLGPVVGPVVVAWFGRRAELAADRIAIQLGYGADLLAVLQRWQQDGHDESARRSTLSHRLFASHPPTATRIRAAQKCLDAALR